MQSLDLAMEQVTVTPRSRLANQTILEANLRQRFGVIVVGIERSGGQLEFNPSPEAVMQAGDQLVVLGRGSSLRDLEVLASGPA